MRGRMKWIRGGMEKDERTNGMDKRRNEMDYQKKKMSKYIMGVVILLDTSTFRFRTLLMEVGIVSSSIFFFQDIFGERFSCLCLLRENAFKV